MMPSNMKNVASMVILCTTYNVVDTFSGCNSHRAPVISATATQIITISDTAGPDISGVPADATVECDAVPAANAEAVSVTDCSGSVTVEVADEVLGGAGCVSDPTVIQLPLTSSRYVRVEVQNHAGAWIELRSFPSTTLFT